MIHSNLVGKRKKTLIFGSVFIILVFIFFTIFLVRIIYIQNNDTDKINEQYISKNYRYATLKPIRGNIYTADGSILATTVMRYDIYIDFKTIKDTLYKNNIDDLADSLSKMFSKPMVHFKKKFDQERKKNNQYYSLVRGLDFDEFDRLRKFPIFNKGQNKGGFIVDRKFHRELATNEIGTGTIGIDDSISGRRIKTGLEGAFSEQLSGVAGRRLEQRVNSRQWKPIDFWEIERPIDGNDVYISMDLRIQDIVSSALEKQLRKFNADYGSVVIMEVATGKIRALVNLKKNKEGLYTDTYNFAVKDLIEPGSTFKTISLLAAMDDGFVEEDTKVNVGGGSWTYQGQLINDGHGGGTYTISDVLAKSSNVGTAKLITKAYADQPQVFIDHLKRWKMLDALQVDLSGSPKPFIYTPEHKKWGKSTLASISYGYSSQFSILQLTTFYNGIANGGKMLKPLFVDKISKNGKIIEESKPVVMVEKMASSQAIKMMTNALTEAVEKGTAKSIFTPNLKMAGKTGTARFEYWKKTAGQMQYRSSFAGFYPADNPKYTCYVLIHNPDPAIGYAGGMVAAPVFKEIAGKTFLKTPQNIEKELLLEKKVNLNKLTSPMKKIEIVKNQMPNLLGMKGKEVVSQLENLGYRVEFKGVGKVVEQFPISGTLIKKNQKIYLKLQY